MVKESIYQEDIAALNGYLPGNRLSKYMKQKLIKLKRKKFCVVLDVYPKSSTDMDIPTVSIYEGHVFGGTSLSFLLDTGFSEGHGLTGRVHLS